MKHQLRHSYRESSGYTLIEVMVAASLTAIISAGTWQLVLATNTLAERSLSASEIECETAICGDQGSFILCKCGGYNYITLR